MKENKEVKISYWAAHLTTVISVSLVLLLVGMVGMVWIGADIETKRLKEKIELSVIMADTVSNAEASRLATEISRQPYAANVKVITKEEALELWKRDTGEDLQQLFGVNPLSPEVTFGIKAEYASAPQISALEKEMRSRPGVESVSTPDASMVDAMNSNIARISWILGAAALIMLAISFVLINNTVHLTIYSRRFTIHTMQLVGATGGFIRRPLVVNNLLSGLLAGLIASGLIALIILTAQRSGTLPAAGTEVWIIYAAVSGTLILLGMFLCSLAAWIASGRYLRTDYDELFK